MSNLDIFDEAERNDDGDLIVKREGRFGSEHDVNLTTLFQPGKRKTSSEQMLKIEASMKADPDKPTPDNPAFPTSPELGDKIAEWCDENDIEPAWLDGPADRDDL